MRAPFNTKEVERAVKVDAVGVGIPAGAAEIFAERTVKAAQKSLKNKSVITKRDLDLALAKELAKYNADLAYVYKNRDTII